MNDPYNAPGVDFSQGMEFNPGFSDIPMDLNLGYFGSMESIPDFSGAIANNPSFGTYRGLDSVSGSEKPQASSGNWLDRLGGFARDITPLLYGAGSIIEGIRGVPRSQSRFAGFNQGNQYDMLARSLGYADGRELIESARTNVKPPEAGEAGGSVVKPSYRKGEDLTQFSGEGGASDGRTLGLEAVLRGAKEYGMSPREFIEMGRRRNYEFGPRASEYGSETLESQGLR
tara:strand:- start:263 stop:949 length:687 start_codon:yes stop_codon:yes gene_type:complete